MRYPDPRLAVPAAVSAGVDAGLRAPGERLLAAARAANAYGLAAAHLGEIAPVVVVSGDPEGRDHLTLYNPRVVAVADETEAGEEGSVALPGIRVDIDRPVWAEVAFMDAEGAARTVRFERFAARVALHEIEQMQGVFFLQRVSRLRRERALKKARKLPG